MRRQASRLQALGFTEPGRSFSCGSMLRSLLLASLLSAAAVRVLAADLVLKVISPEKTLQLGAVELRRLPHTEFVATDPHEKGQHRCSGVAVRDLLTQVGAPLSEKLRGKALQLAVLSAQATATQPCSPWPSSATPSAAAPSWSPTAWTGLPSPANSGRSGS